MRKLSELNARVHEEIVGEGKEKERCLGCSWRDCYSVMPMSTLVMLGFDLCL
jgi:hypothetical protein